MNVLITGGAGFIGSHLAEKLLAAGHAVTALDNLSTGSLRNIEHLLDQKGFRFIEDSIFNYKLLDKEIADCDTVIHLAAAVGVKLIVKKPIETILTNIRGSEIVLDLCGQHGNRLLIASTSEVYGKNSKAPFTEDDDMVLGPTSKNRWSYACSKAIDEFLALAYHREKGLPVSVLRFFNTVGPRQTGDWGMVLPTFVQQALAGTPMTVYGDGQQQRSFTSVFDAIEYINRLLPIADSHGRIFNIGNPREVSISQLAEMVKAKVGSASPIQRIPYDQAYEPGFEDMERRLPDISRIVAITGYKPQFSLEQIIDQTIAYFRQQEK